MATRHINKRMGLNPWPREERARVFTPNPEVEAAAEAKRKRRAERNLRVKKGRYA